MSTQHPDNAGVPYWKYDHNAFVSSADETTECMDAFENLNVEEFMWDWEGKFTDEAVTDRLFHHHYNYFKKNPLGLKKRLTFRIPNIWQEKGYSLLRSLMVILTSEDFARDLKFHSPPLFEIILPMTENAKQLIFIQKSFKELAELKSKIFGKKINSEYIKIIPLFEGVGTQIKAKEIMQKYLELHKETFGFFPSSLRVFLARSDPAMVSGIVPTVLANKIALSDLRELSEETGIHIYPILGAGSLPFRGALNPNKIKEFDREYPGVNTITIQSAFRYDYPKVAVKKAIKYYNEKTGGKSTIITKSERKELIQLINIFEKRYQQTLKNIITNLKFVFGSFPRRRERHLHIGLLSYGRKINNMKMPRAINFTGSFYSLGIPPEFLGTGEMSGLTESRLKLLNKYYINLSNHVKFAGRFLNWNNLEKLSKNKNWMEVMGETEKLEKLLKTKFGPQNKDDLEHMKLSSSLLGLKNNPKKIQQNITKMGVLRKSLG
jgi:phosphoenolpyruvate carboxylase